MSIFSHLTAEELMTIDMLPGRTRLAKLKFCIALTGGAMASKIAGDAARKEQSKADVLHAPVPGLNLK